MAKQRSAACGHWFLFSFVLASVVSCGGGTGGSDDTESLGGAALMGATMEEVEIWGKPDEEFGGGDGVVVTPVRQGAQDDFPQGMAIQADGKIVVAGYSYADFCVVRYNPDGSLDFTFDKDGKVITEVTPWDNRGRAVAVQPDGKILVAGDAFTYDREEEAYYSRCAVVRYNADGSLDTTFGSTNTTVGGGKVILGIQHSYARAVALQPDGKIIVVGQMDWPIYSAPDSLLVVRYHPDGSLDETFNGSGVVLTQILPDKAERAGGERGIGVAVQPDGKVVVAGGVVSYDGVVYGYDFAVVRYNPDGSLDTTFSHNGMVTTSIGSGSDEVAKAMLLQPDGKIVVVGHTNVQYIPLFFGIAMVRYNPDGSLDPKWGGNGIVVATPESEGRYSHASAVAIQADGKIVVAGARFNGQIIHDFLVRYTTGGSVDASFGYEGWVRRAEFSYDPPCAVAIQPADHKIVIAGDCYDDFPDGSQDFLVARYR